MREIVDLLDDLVQPLDVLGHQLAELTAEFGVVVVVREQLGKGLDRNQRVSHLMGHAGRQFGPELGALDLFLFLLQREFSCQVLD